MSTGVRTIWRILAPHARRHRGALVLLVLLAWVSELAQKAVIPLLQPVLAVLGAIQPSEPKANPGWWERTGRSIESWLVAGAATTDEKIDACVRIALVVAGLALLAGVTQYFFVTLSRWMSLRIIADLRTRIARHVMGLSMGYHGRRHFGDLLSRVNNDVTLVASLLNQSLKELIQEPLSALSCLIVAAFYAPVPTLFAALGVVIMGIVVARQSKKVKKGSSRSQKELGSSVQVLTQMFQGVRTVKAFRAEERELAEYVRTNEGYVRSAMKMVRAQALSNGFTTLVSHLGMGAMIVLIAWLTLEKGQFGGNIAGIAIFFLLVAQLYASVKGVARAVTYVHETVGAAERLQALFDERSDVHDRPGGRAVSGLGSGLRFEGVTFAYPDGHGNALERLDLEVHPGETLALVGPSGSGKSTVVDLVARFLDPTEGRVTAGGHDLRDLTVDSWTAQYAMVGQTPFLFHATIGENIRYGKPGATQAEVEAAARAAGIHDFIATLPQGYDTNVADAGSRLSGGQRQRITIARAFLKGAPLLLLDEATSALDTESEAVVQAALERLMADRTVIVIAHRLSTIKNADRIAVLEHGRIVEIGTHAELLARNGAYARLAAADRAPARV